MSKSRKITCPYCEKPAYIVTYSPTNEYFKCFHKKKCGKSMPYAKFLYENDFEKYKELVGNPYLTKDGECYSKKHPPRYSSETLKRKQAEKFVRENCDEHKERFSKS